MLRISVARGVGDSLAMPVFYPAWAVRASSSRSASSSNRCGGAVSPTVPANLTFQPVFSRTCVARHAGMQRRHHATRSPRHPCSSRTDRSPATAARRCVVPASRAPSRCRPWPSDVRKSSFSTKLARALLHDDEDLAAACVAISGAPPAPGSRAWAARKCRSR